jgi:hypothetical protein
MLAFSQPEPNPDNLTNRKLASLVNAELKKAPENEALLNYKQTWADYSRQFRALPLEHLKSLEKIKGAQAKFESYLGELGQLLGKHTNRKFEGIFDDFTEHFAAIGLILENVKLATIVPSLKKVDLKFLYQKVEELQRDELKQRTERIKNQLKAYHLSKEITK